MVSSIIIRILTLNCAVEWQLSGFVVSSGGLTLIYNHWLHDCLFYKCVEVIYVYTFVWYVV